MISLTIDEMNKICIEFIDQINSLIVAEAPQQDRLILKIDAEKCKFKDKYIASTCYIKTENNNEVLLYYIKEKIENIPIYQELAHSCQYWESQKWTPGAILPGVISVYFDYKKLKKWINKLRNKTKYIKVEKYR